MTRHRALRLYKAIEPAHEHRIKIFLHGIKFLSTATIAAAISTIATAVTCIVEPSAYTTGGI